jgi:hypothetical protein
MNGFTSCVFLSEIYFTFQGTTEHTMNEETFNLSIRAFLKRVGINSQREIEHAVARAIETGAIAGTESVPVTMTLEIAELKLHVKFDGEIKLE